MRQPTKISLRIVAFVISVYHEGREIYPAIREQSTTAIQPIASQPSTPPWLTAARAAESKKATDIKVLDLTGITSFADYFVICTGSNSKQVQAIADEVGMQLKKLGEHPVSLEGYAQAEWILADYGDFLVHVFSTKAREYYDLERLWRAGKTVLVPSADIPAEARA